jgi:hypothetical protein
MSGQSGVKLGCCIETEGNMGSVQRGAIMLYFFFLKVVFFYTEVEELLAAKWVL